MRIVRSDLPHELSGGISVERTEPEGLVRYAKVAVHYVDRPYRDALRTLRADIYGLWSAIGALETHDVYAGRRTVIRPKQ